MAFSLPVVWIFLQKNMCKSPCLEMLLLNFNLGHVRLYDVDPLCFQLIEAVTGHLQAYYYINIR